MNHTLFVMLASAVSLYSMLCFVRIILTWIPDLAYSRFTQILATICDPYMNLFRGIRWLRMGNFDFSPALALCLLGAVSSLLKSIAYGGSFSLASILAVAVQVVFSIISSLLVFIIIVFIVRLVVIMMSRNQYSSSSFMLNQIDSSISPLVYRIARTFSFGRTVTYKSALVISIIALIFTNIALTHISGFIISLVMTIPV
ncbi:MAG: YggT family protein [Treponema sp.]|nr:YggT family protein [Candidatus Treponema equi]